MEDNLENWRSIIRSCVITSKTPLTLEEINSDTKMLEGKDIPFRKFNFPSLEKMIESTPGLKLFRANGKVYAQVIPNEKTEHIAKMVQLQKGGSKKNKKNKLKAYLDKRAKAYNNNRNYNFNYKANTNRINKQHYAPNQNKPPVQAADEITELNRQYQLLRNKYKTDTNQINNQHYAPEHNKPPVQVAEKMTNLNGQYQLLNNEYKADTNINKRHYVLKQNKPPVQANPESSLVQTLIYPACSSPIQKPKNLPPPKIGLPKPNLVETRPWQEKNNFKSYRPRNEYRNNFAPYQTKNDYLASSGINKLKQQFPDPCSQLLMYTRLELLPQPYYEFFHGNYGLIYAVVTIGSREFRSYPKGAYNNYRAQRLAAIAAIEEISYDESKSNHYKNNRDYYETYQNTPSCQQYVQPPQYYNVQPSQYYNVQPPQYYTVQPPQYCDYNTGQPTWYNSPMYY